MNTNPQLQGIESIPGTYIFDLRASHKALRLNRFLWRLSFPIDRARFLANESEAMQAAELDKTEQQLIQARDWLGLVRYGASFFALEKLARVLTTSNLEMYAAMRSETFDQFLKTRRVPDAR
jgi:hypothetical protein